MENEFKLMGSIDACSISGLYKNIGNVIEELAKHTENERCIMASTDGKMKVLNDIYIVRSISSDYVNIIFDIANSENIEINIDMKNFNNGLRISKFEQKIKPLMINDYEYCNDNCIIYTLLLYDDATMSYSKGAFIHSQPKVFVNYKKYIQSEEWNIKRKAKLKDTGYKCQLCSANETELHVHHNNYKKLGNEEMTDLIVLCKECHSKFHDKLEIIEENN